MENKFNEINTKNIVAAGKAIKSVVYIIVSMIILITIGIIIATTETEPNVIKNTYIFIGLVGFICNVFILFRLYDAGVNLESVNSH